MNPIWIKNKDIDKTKWDFCISNCQWGKIYALSKYLDFITEKNWEAIIVGEYEYIMPVPIKSKAGIEITYRPDFCQQLGVFTLNSELDKIITQLFIKKLTERFKAFVYPMNHFISVDINSSIDITVKTNLVIDLKSNYSEIHSKYSKELIRNLKRAENFKLSISENISVDKLISIYKKSWQNRYKISEQTYSNFKNLLIWAKENNLAIIKAAIKGDEILSCCIIFIFKNRIYYPFSAITEQGKKFNSTEFLINSIIKEHSNTGNLFDFEGSEIPSVKAFYKKFSPINEPYLQISKNVYFLDKIIFFRKFLKNVLHFRKM